MEKLEGGLLLTDTGMPHCYMLQGKKENQAA